ncbi:MAG TPA: hypothetical protein VJ698_22220 [Noviherbaspirillum sp.]|uniref:hypothetical protein n=1 Tax=Noviherbaspirillum sp. TaxID=1926288 RepID=UPI002B4A0D26|nr:hypothetical protein [Noviherbaspirillum sp.]HJV88202.1 hypothetical protein [Noviherbaspirillum sp.]
MVDLSGINLLVGSISRREAENSDTSTCTRVETHDHARQASIVHADEPGRKESGRGHWLRLGGTGSARVFLVAVTRGL